MRWVVEIPDPSGGTAATVTVEARSWLEGLTKARGGVALAKYHAEIDDDGLVRVLDRNTRDRFTVRPMRSISPDLARPLSPPPEAPLLFSSPPPADAVFSDAPKPAPSPAPPAATSSSPPGEKSTLISHRSVYALGGSEPPVTGAHAAARGGRAGGPRRSPSSSELPRVNIPAPQTPARKSPPPAATDSTPPGERPSQPRTSEAPSSAVAALALDYKSQHDPSKERASHPEVAPPAASRHEVHPPPADAPVDAPPVEAAPPAASALVTAVDAAPPVVTSPESNGLSSHPADAAPDNHRSDTLVVPTVTAHDGLVEPLPVPTVLFERDEEPSPERPIAYRERVFAVPSGTTRERAEALARQSFAAIKRALTARPRGRFVSIAVFDEEFTSRPSVPPLVVLEWKDWRGDPTVAYPDSLPPPPPEPVVEKAPEPVAPPTAPSVELSKRPRVATESDISMVEVVPPAVPPAAIPTSDVSMVEVLPPAVPPAAIPSSDISMVEVLPPPVPAALEPVAPAATPAPAPSRPTPTPAPSAAARAPEGKGKRDKDKKRRRNRTSSESNISTSTAMQATKSSGQTPAERDAPTMVVPVYKAPDPPAAAPVVLAKEAPAVAPVAAVEAAPSSPPSTSPAAPAPVPEVAPAPAAAVAPAAAAPAVEAAPTPAVEATPASVPEATVPPADPVAAAPAPVEPPPAAAPVAPEAASTAAPVSLAKPEAPAPAAKPAVVPTRSVALTAKRRRGKELVGDLFDALMDLSFTQSPEDACSFAARVLHEYVVCDGCSVALYDIDRDEFVVSASEGVSVVGNRDKAGRGSRTLAVRKRSAVNLKRGDATEGLADHLAGGPSVFVPAFHRDRLFALVTLQRMPGGPSFETDEEDGASYVASQLAEALAGHSKRAGAKQLDEEIRKSGAPKRR